MSSRETIRAKIAAQVRKHESKKGYGPHGLKERGLMSRVLGRDELPVIRVEEKVVHGQLVKVKVLAPGEAAESKWWRQEPSSKKFHTSHSIEPVLAQMRW